VARRDGQAPQASERSDFEPPLRVYVEPWPSGGWAVRLEAHPVPVSRHDTEEEAESRAASYRRGLQTAAFAAAVDPPAPSRDDRR
jgi:hypothetical protein